MITMSKVRIIDKINNELKVGDEVRTKVASDDVYENHACNKVDDGRYGLRGKVDAIRKEVFDGKEYKMYYVSVYKDITTKELDYIREELEKIY